MIRGTLEHPKFLDLQARLDVPRYRVAGLLECLWHFTARYAPEGDVGKWQNRAIARALEWDGDPDQLVEALVGAGWLESLECARLYVHDWHEHADDGVHRALARATKFFANGQKPRMTRLGEVERLSLQSKYDKLGAQSAHGGRTVEAHDVRTVGARSAPLPAPPDPRPASAPPEEPADAPDPPAAAESAEAGPPSKTELHEAAAKLERDVDRALRILADQSGAELEEKRRWLRAELRSAESWAADATAAGRRTSTRSAVIRFWQRYSRDPPAQRRWWVEIDHEQQVAERAEVLRRLGIDTGPEIREPLTADQLSQFQIEHVG